MNDYLRSRGLSGPAWEMAKATGEVIYDVTVETPRGIKKTVIDPIGDGIEEVVSFSVDDIVPDGMDSAIDGVVTGSWQKKWDKITGYSIKSIISDVLENEADPVTVLHGRAMDADSNYRAKYRVPQNVKIIGASDPMFEKQNIFTMFGDNPYNQESNILDKITVGYIDDAASHSEGPIYGPFSKYAPTALWPWQTSNGRRMTAAELAEVPLEGDWFGTKPIAEALIGQDLDKVGGIPGYRFWGEGVLLTPFILTGLVGFFTAPIWLPPLTAATTFVGKLMLPFP
tara:strand:- start:3179 stop:4030 length:852 start_codon:yes stop_codon:yes gene_type:complete